MKACWCKHTPAMLNVLVLLVLCVSSAVARQASLALEGTWATGAKSLCDLSIEPLPWVEFVIAPGEESPQLTQCSDAEFPPQELDALTLKVQNLGTVASPFDIPRLSQVSVRAGERSASPIAVLFHIEGIVKAGNYLKCYYKRDYQLKITIPAGSTASVLYLVPKVAGSRIVTVAGRGELRITPTPRSGRP